MIQLSVLLLPVILLEMQKYQQYSHYGNRIHSGRKIYVGS